MKSVLTVKLYQISSSQVPETSNFSYTNLVFLFSNSFTMAAVSTRFAPLPLTQPQSSCRSQASINIEGRKTYTLNNFIDDVKVHLGESGGIGCEDVDEDYIISLAKKYMSNPNDWARYYHNCPGKNYTRNAIININKKANIVRHLFLAQWNWN